MPKYVVSGTLEEATRNNSSIISGDVAAGIRDLKVNIEGDITLSGSATLVRVAHWRREADDPQVRRMTTTGVRSASIARPPIQAIRNKDIDGLISLFAPDVVYFDMVRVCNTSDLRLFGSDSWGCSKASRALSNRSCVT